MAAAAALDVADVAALFGDRFRDAGEHARPVAGLDDQGDREHRVVAPRPLDADLPFGVVQQVAHVGAVHGVDRNAPAAGHEADDLLARQRAAAAGEEREHVVLTLDHQPGLVAGQYLVHRLAKAAGPLIPASQPFRRQDRAQHRLDRTAAEAQPAEQLVDAPVALGGHEVRHLLRVEHAARAHPVAAQFTGQHRAADLDRTLLLLGVDPLTDLAPRPRRGDDVQPVAAGFAVRVRRDLDDVAVVQFGAQRHQPAVHPRAAAVMAEFRVNAIGEVERRRAAGERQHVALGREHVDLVGIEIDLERAQEGARVRHLLLPLEELAQPDDADVVLVRVELAPLVPPVRRHALLREQVHRLGPNLDLERLPAAAEHRRVQRLVQVRLRHRDVVPEAARNGTPDLVHDAERGVGALHVDRDDPEGQEVEQVRQIDLPAAELLVNRVVALHPVTDLGFDVRFLKRLAQTLGDSPGRAPDPLDPLVELSPDVLVVVRMQVPERPVLQHALNPRHPQPVGERRVDLQRLARDPPPLPGLEMLQGEHVVEAIDQLHHDDPQIAGRGQDQLAEALRLHLVAADVLVAADLRHAVHEVGDLVSELRRESFLRGPGVLQDVVQQADGDARLIEVELGQHVGDTERMADVRVARTPDLPAVGSLGVLVRATEPGFVADALVLFEATDDLADPHVPGLPHRERILGSVRRGHRFSLTPRSPSSDAARGRTNPPRSARSGSRRRSTSTCRRAPRSGAGRRSRESRRRPG